MIYQLLKIEGDIRYRKKLKEMKKGKRDRLVLKVVEVIMVLFILIQLYSIFFWEKFWLSVSSEFDQILYPLIYLLNLFYLHLDVLIILTLYNFLEIC